MNEDWNWTENSKSFPEYYEKKIIENEIDDPYSQTLGTPINKEQRTED